MQISARNITLSYQSFGTFSKEQMQENLEKTLKNNGIKIDKKELENLSKNSKANGFYAYSFELSITEISIQGSLNEIAYHKGEINEFLKDFKDFTKKNLNQEIAKEKISENGEFGAKNTAKRLAEQIIKNAGNDSNNLKAAKNALNDTFEQAMKRFGSSYKDLANKTIENAIDLLNKQIAKLGENILQIDA